VTRQDILEKPVRSIYLGIGSNLGNKLSNIENAKNLILKNNIYIEDCSSFYETPSWPNNKFPNFLNIVIKINTDLSITNLFKIVKNIEKKIGRKKSLRNYPRVCDIDIIDFKGLLIKTHLNEHKIESPHPRIESRNFVIFPLFELNKNWIHPKTKASISSIINQFSIKDFSDIRIV
tara:strand:- start:110 stop:637 length:528 start_codon:yes stop_codon:yes gene_type:complete